MTTTTLTRAQVDGQHDWACEYDDDDWLIVRCRCGWEFGIVEHDDAEQAADALMDHAMHVAQLRMIAKFGHAFDEIYRFIVELDLDPAADISAYVSAPELAAFTAMCDRFFTPKPVQP